VRQHAEEVEMYWWKLPLAVACLTLALGCDAFKSLTEPDEPAVAQRGECLSCGATVDSGGIGRFRLGMSDADWLPEKCGFTIYKGHVGGYGNTLEMTGCGIGIYLHWRYNSLAQVDLESGWSGRTDRGIRLGATRQEVLAAYSRASSCGTGESLKAVENGNAIVFDFSPDGTVARLVVGEDSTAHPCLYRYKDH
jgi:hypothetical protein